MRVIRTFPGRCRMKMRVRTFPFPIASEGHQCSSWRPGLEAVDTSIKEFFQFPETDASLYGVLSIT